MNKTNFKFLKTPWFWFFLSLVFRFGLLVWNIHLELPPSWQYVSWTSLYYGNMLCGHPMADMEKIVNLNATFLHEDKGLAYLHYFLCSISGQSSFLKQQILQIFLDSSVVYALWSIAGKITTRVNVPTYSAALYSIFLPSIYAALNPIWYTYTIFGVTHACALILSSEKKQPVLLILLRYFSAFALLIMASQCRATNAILMIFVAGVLLFLSVVFSRLKMQRRAFGILALGICVFLGNAVTNKITSKGTQIMRSHYAAAFWDGMGEMSNPYGVVGTDSGIGDFFYANNPDAPKGLDLYSPQVNAWLEKKMFETIVSNPALVMKKYLHSFLNAIFPNIRFSFIADLESYNEYEGKVLGSRENRLQMLSQKNIQGLIATYPRFAFEYFLRILVMAFFPMGLICYFIFARVKFENLFCLAVVLYPCMFLTILRLPVFDHAAIWVVALPMCLDGFLNLFDWIMVKVKGRRVPALQSSLMADV